MQLSDWCNVALQYAITATQYLLDIQPRSDCIMEALQGDEVPGNEETSPMNIFFRKTDVDKQWRRRHQQRVQ